MLQPAVARFRGRVVALARARLPAPIRRALGRGVRRLRRLRTSPEDLDQMRSAQAAALATAELSVHELTAQVSALERTLARVTERLERLEGATGPEPT